MNKYVLVPMDSCSNVRAYTFFFFFCFYIYVLLFDCNAKRCIGKASFLVANFWNGGGRASENLLLHQSDKNPGENSQIHFFGGMFEIN